MRLAQVDITDLAKHGPRVRIDLHETFRTLLPGRPGRGDVPLQLGQVEIGAVGRHHHGRGDLSAPGIGRRDDRCVDDIQMVAEPSPYTDATVSSSTYI